MSNHQSRIAVALPWPVALLAGFLYLVVAGTAAVLIAIFVLVRIVTALFVAVLRRPTNGANHGN